MSLLRLVMAGGAGCLCFLALGCNREEPIKAYQAPKEPAHVHRERIEWKLPVDWIEWPGDGELTYAGFTVEDSDPALEMTVTTLSRRDAPSAADVTANVNRWQRQLEMPGSSPEEIAQLAKRVKVDGLEGYVVNLLGPAGDSQKRIL